MNDFDLIAPFYDQLAKIIFGKAILQSQIYFLNEVKENDQVLIIGGGTGELLRYLPACDSVTFLDKSKRMVDLAKRTNTNPKVSFLNEDFFAYSSDKQFDVIICSFFLDCFDHMNLKRVISKTQQLLKAGGKLVVADFQGDPNWHIMKLMHFFFSVVAALESKKLKNMHSFILSQGFYVEKERFFLKKKIFSRVYRNL